MDLSEYLRIKKEADTRKEESSRLEGAEDQFLAQLKEKFGCSSFSKAEKLYQKKLSELENSEGRLRKLQEEYDRKYGDCRD